MRVPLIESAGARPFGSVVRVLTMLRESGLSRIQPKTKVPDRAIYLIDAVSIAIATVLVEQLELLASMVSFGARVGFLMLPISVVVHFIVREKSRNWARHLVVPVIGFAVAAYVLINAQADAMIAGNVWIAVGLVLFVVLKMTGRQKFQILRICLVLTQALVRLPDRKWLEELAKWRPANRYSESRAYELIKGV